MQFYNPGVPIADEDKFRKQDGKPNLGAAHRINDSGVPVTMVPQIYTQYLAPNGEIASREEWMECPEGSAAIGVYGHGFWVVKKGQWWDSPNGVQEKAIKELCPHLLTEQEALAQGITKDQTAQPKAGALKKEK